MEEKLDIEAADAKIEAAYNEGVAEREGNEAPEKTWIWCSDNKCSQRREFSSYSACYAHKQSNGGYCY